MTFKVGDRVKPTTGHFLGVEGVIVRLSVINENAVHVRFPRDNKDYAYDVLDLEIVPNSETDSVNPGHYDFQGAQVIDITRHMSFTLGNVVKYCTRAGRKGDALEDLLKARKYLDWAIEDAESQ